MRKIVLIVFCLNSICAFAQSNKSVDSSKCNTFIESQELYKKANKVFQEMIPEIKDIVKKKIGPVSKRFLKNNTLLRKYFETTYQFLPLPMRLLFSQKKFTDLCMENKSLLLEVIP